MKHLLSAPWRQNSKFLYKFATNVTSARIRSLTSSEVSTALRPFYFLIHPDLFGKYPSEQAQNEKSLQTLKNYIDTLVVDRQKPVPKEVTFFLKPRSSDIKESQQLRTVKIRLLEGNVRGAVTKILKNVGLPTGYVESIPESSVEEVKHIFPFDSEEEVPAEKESFGYSSTDVRQPLLLWLQNNIQQARQRLHDCEPVRLETEKLQGEICYKFGLNDILWNCGWDTHHRRGVIESFNYLATQYPEVQGILKNRTVVFGQHSGVSTRGEIILYSGEVRNNWLNVIKNVPKSEQTLHFLPLYEKALSESLEGMSIVDFGDDCVLLDDYRVRLRKLVTTLGDYKLRNKLPGSWNANLSEFKLCVESEASSMMLSPEGVYIIPASTPAFLLVDFITKHLDLAKNRMKENLSLDQEELRLTTQCVNELGLIQLDRENSITSAQMIYCTKLLLENSSRLRHLTHGNHLIVTSFFMVKSDGTICIPWDPNLEGNTNDDRTSNNPALKLIMY